MMKIAVDRSTPGFWVIYFMVHFCLFMIIQFVIHLLWTALTSEPYLNELAKMAFESFCYSITLTLIRLVRYHIGRRRYQKNPVDRRKNNLFRE